MADTTSTQTNICDDCLALKGASRHATPHKNLRFLEFKPVKSMFGSVDETYYKCSVCGKEWLHETGSYGQGWVE
jgi:hypothetical protein